MPNELEILSKYPIIEAMLTANKQRLGNRLFKIGVVIIPVGVLVLVWLYYTPPGLLGKADAVGYSVCHQIDSRSFHINGRQFPMCARCTGQFLGAMLAIFYQSVVGKRRVGRPGWSVIAVLVALFVAYAVDGMNSYLHLQAMVNAFPNLPRLYEPSNTLRLLTGTGVGLVIGSALYPSFHSVAWRKPDPRPALAGLGSVGGMILLALVLDGLLLIENPWILYPMAILTALATLTLLAMVYTIIVLMLARRENRAERFAQLTLPFITGLGIALLQIALIDLLRYLLTGTWDGFHLG